MGCDIHLFMEQRINGVWKAVEGRWPSSHWHYYVPDAEMPAVLAKAVGVAAGAAAPSTADASTTLPAIIEVNADTLRHLPLDTAAALFGQEPWFPWTDGAPDWMGSRNYALFSVLADVRNTDRSSERIPPIAKPRGLPADASAAAQESHTEWGVDAHSASHVTLAELVAYNWDAQLRRTTFVDEENYRKYIATGRPDMSFRCVGTGGGAVVLSLRDMNDLIKGKYPRKPGETYYCEITLNTSVAESVHRPTIDAWLTELKRHGAPEDVRVVFWFDN